ncbi:MAG: tRNA sulfurtransferase [Desulfurococcaceae archaeon]
MPKYLVTVSGEIPLRSPRTRPRFYRVLVENIRDAVERNGGRLLESKVLEAKILLETDVDVEEAIARVFGVHKVGRVLEYVFRDLPDLANWVQEHARESVKGRKFAVRVKRSGEHSFTSLDVAREVGAVLKPYSAGVDLENPDVVVDLEVRGDKAFLYLDSRMGPGGIPIGVEGSALVLFSGGFDSPVAAWLIAKRGVKVDFLHFIMGSTQSTYYAFQVAKALASNWLYGYKPRFILVDFRDVIAEISRRTKWSFRQVVLRALMYIASTRLASKLGYDAVVTGEAIGQASSQTLRNLSAIERAAGASMMILRPLLGYDKDEIIALSRKIGLYDYSSKVTETCAIAPLRVETGASLDEVREELSKIDLTIIDKALSDYKVVSVLEASPDEAIPRSDVEIDFIPEDAVIIDARSESERRNNPIEKAIPIEEVNVKNLPRDKVLIFICETGGKSYLLAKTLREEGFRAYSFKGGARNYCKLRG